MHAKDPHYTPEAPITRRQRRAADRSQVHHRRRHHEARRYVSILPVIVVVVAIAVFAAVLLGQQNSTPAAHAQPLTQPARLDPAASLLKVGTTAPNFTLRDGSGKQYSLAAQRGHPVVVEGFAVWCPQCHREAPILARMDRTFAARGVRTWAILSNPYGSNYEFSGGKDLRLADRSDLKSYRSDFNARYPLLIDPTFSTVNRYGVAGYPTLYVIDGKGKVVLATAGHLPYPTLAAAVEKALSRGHTS
jgi:peroxiredoxin